MKLTEDINEWCFLFTEGIVQLIQIDFALNLILSDGPENVAVRLGMPCRFLEHGNTVTLIPEETSSLCPILSTFNCSVIDITIRKTGHLVLHFADDRLLEVDPDEKYEAWQLTSKNLMLVCKPGGGFTIFRE